MSYWYVARTDELLLDLDQYDRPTKSGEWWGEVFFRRRLRQAIKCGKLKVREVWMLPSQTVGHFHAVVRLNEELTRLRCLVWQMQLGSDLYRSRADLMRHARGFRAASLLITPTEIPDFYRSYDFHCPCTKKHITEDLMAMPPHLRCNIWNELRGMSPWELFGEPSHESEIYPPSIPVGKVDMEWVLSRVLSMDGQLEYCDNCEGVGWYEGGPTLKTVCKKCNGRGIIHL